MKKNIESECSILDGLPQELHPFDTTCRIHEKLSALGWIWRTSTEAADKVREELGEAQEAESQKDREHLEEECGDLLFSALNTDTKFCRLHATMRLYSLFEEF